MSRLLSNGCDLRGRIYSCVTCWLSALNVLNPDVSNLTQTYLSIQVRAISSYTVNTVSIIHLQYNALLTLASKDGKDLYSSNWHGPAPASLNPLGQMEALDTLNSGIGILADSPSPR